MKRIPLTQGKYAIVDADLYPLLTAMGPWCYHPKGYAVRTTRIRGKQHTARMHRVVLKLAGYVVPRQVDHRNTRKLDNRLLNLRPATSSQNHGNERRRRNNKSGYKGVCWHGASNKWRATITVERKMHHLGVFVKLTDAARAYDSAARKHFGRFARTNFGLAA